MKMDVWVVINIVDFRYTWKCIMNWWIFRLSINRLKVDFINKIIQYSSYNFNYVSLCNIKDNNMLFYLNNCQEGKVIIL